MVRRYALGLIIISFQTGCEKQTGEAVVLSKEHIAAAQPTTETSAAEHPPPSNEQSRPIPDDEITVDEYVMKPEVRGTSRDPRALKEEQWLVKVRLIDSGRTFNVQADQSQFDKLMKDDRVQVRYRIGKYTKTIWGAQIERGKE
jgi:hypothetical protein